MLGALRPVIVGYGRAGRDLHHCALRPLLEGDDMVILVDPSHVAPPPRSRWLPAVVDVVRAADETGTPIGDLVFHVTTPPASHLTCVAELIGLGAEKIILEKPVAVSSIEAQQIARYSEEISILPTSVWLSSRITVAIEEFIEAGAVGTPLALHIEQSKPRFRRTIGSITHATAFEIELPHQVLLAEHLAGPARHIESASCWPMTLPGHELSGMGGAMVELTHQSGLSSTLISDLTSPIRCRRMRVTGTQGMLVADYPISSDDDFGQLRIAGRSERMILQDAPLTQFIDKAYAHFRGDGPPPPGDVAAHVRTIGVLEQARDMAADAAPQRLEFQTWPA
jgi:predicted dehydrogenase